MLYPEHPLYSVYVSELTEFTHPTANNRQHASSDWQITPSFAKNRRPALCSWQYTRCRQPSIFIKQPTKYTHP